MTQSLIFDMDGTLFQTGKILELSLEDAFERLRSLKKWNAKHRLINIVKLWVCLCQKYGKR